MPSLTNYNLGDDPTIQRKVTIVLGFLIVLVVGVLIANYAKFSSDNPRPDTPTEVDLPMGTDLEKAQAICFGNGMKNILWKDNRIVLLECNH